METQITFLTKRIRNKAKNVSIRDLTLKVTKWVSKLFKEEREVKKTNSIFTPKKEEKI